MSTLSFIIPAYNAQTTLARCVSSICNQPYKDIEIIIVDDGSTDNTLSTANSLSCHDNRIHVFHQENMGVSAARNRGITQASGDYLFFCDSDDWIESGAISKIASILNSSPADVFIFDHIRETHQNSECIQLFSNQFLSNDRTTIEVIQQLLLQIQPSKIPNPSFAFCNGLGGAAWHFIFRKELIESNQIQFDSYLDGLLEDGLFVMTALEYSSSIEYHSFPLYHYCALGYTSTHGYHPDFDKRCERAIERFYAFGKERQKKRDYYRSLNARAMYFVNKLCEVDFFCSKNPFSEQERYYSFCTTLTSKSFSKALKDLPIEQLASSSEKIQAQLLSRGYFKLYWNLRKAKQQIRNNIQKIKRKL